MAFSRPPISSIPSINLANTMLPSDSISPSETIRRSSSVPRNGLRNSRGSVVSPPMDSRGQENNYSALQKILEETTRSARKLRDMHNKEREQWHEERTEFESRIERLEDLIASLMKDRNMVMSPNGTMRPKVTSPLANFSSPPSGQTTRSTAVWMGAESQTTRHYSEPAVGSSHKSVNVMAPISESGERKKSVAFENTVITGKSRQESSPAIPGGLINPNWEGIPFKSTAPVQRHRGAVSGTVSEENRSDTPSPGNYRQPTSEDVPQGIPRPRLLDLPTANMQSEELYHSDAGHTPLARVVGGEASTEGLTPIAQERLPLEPAPIRDSTRPPNERQDSYFQHAKAQTDDAQEEDPSLQGPLNTYEDAGFLDKVNEALEKQMEEAREARGLPPASLVHARNTSEVEPFPPLRLKPSKNFGAPFGMTKPGQGL